MKEIGINKIYTKEDVPDGLSIRFDEKHPENPHWIWVRGFEKRPRFLSVRTAARGEIIYKAFGDLYYPIDDTPAQEVQRDLLAAAATNYDEIVGDLNPKIADFIFAQSQKLSLPNSAKVLDLGAGTGITSLPFLKNDYKDTTLVDISKEMLSVAKSKLKFSSAKFIVQDLRSLVLPEKYDLVISSMVLCDFDDLDLNKVLSKLVKFLNDGAHIILVEDTDREVYQKYFLTIASGFAPFNEYHKFYFVGRLR